MRTYARIFSLLFVVAAGAGILAVGFGKVAVLAQTTTAPEQRWICRPADTSSSANAQLTKPSTMNLICREVYIQVQTPSKMMVIGSVVAKSNPKSWSAMLDTRKAESAAMANGQIETFMQQVQNMLSTTP
jgi:hypothetical protein